MSGAHKEAVAGDFKTGRATEERKEDDALPGAQVSGCVGRG